jgi:hypothetical protein
MLVGTVIGPELELAIASCRWSYSGEALSTIEDLSRQVDWPLFLHTIRRHRVQGLVNLALRKSGIAPPSSIGAAISSEARQVAQRNLRSARESECLLESFSDAGIDLLFVKGLTLSAVAYGDPFVKMGSDIDILIGPWAVGKGAAILEFLGYQPSYPAVETPPVALPNWHRRHKESVWYNPVSGLGLDLHTALSDNPALIPGIGIGSTRQTVAITPTLSLPTLGADDLFAYLCVHGASSAWFRLKWIVDLAALLFKIGPGEVERLYRTSQHLGAGRTAAQALLLGNRLSLIHLPNSLRSELRRDHINTILADVSLRQLLTIREPGERFLGTAAIHWTQPLLMKGWAFKLAEVTRQVNDFIRRPE